MAVVTSEDITVAWGCAPPPDEALTGRWRTAIFQDVQEASDASCLYFLYDPVPDQRPTYPGGYRKSGNCVVVFDLSLKCFTREIPIYVPGSPKFLFALRPQVVGGETRAVIVSQIDMGGAVQIHFTLLNLANGQHCPITAPLDIARDFICTIREDAPELIVMSNPGLQVWRLALDVMTATEPLEYFRVIGAQLNHFYDGFICGGVVFFVSANPDGTLDYTRVHLLDMQTRSITTRACTPDARGKYPCARLQAAIVALSRCIIVCGGEVIHAGRYGAMGVQRLSDYWRLDLKAFQWEQCSGQMPCPFIEPRVTSTYAGQVYLWGDWDGELPGIASGVSHLRIVRVDGFDQPFTSVARSAPPVHSSVPPPYQQANQGKHPQYDNVPKEKKSKCCCNLL